MMPPGWTPWPDSRFKEVIAAYKEAFAKSPPPRLVALSAIGTEKPDGLGAMTSLALMEEGFSRATVPRRICSGRGILRELPLWFTSRPKRCAASFLRPDGPEVANGRE